MAPKVMIFCDWNPLKFLKRILVGVAIECEKKNWAILVKIFTKWHFGQCVDLRRVPSTVYDSHMKIPSGNMKLLLFIYLNCTHFSTGDKAGR